MADENTEEVVIEEVAEPVIPDETTATDPSEDQIDYKAVAETERKRREEAEQLIIKNKIKAKKPEETTDQDKPLTVKDLAEVETRIRTATTRELQEQRALEIARSNTSSEEEAQAAMVYWKNRVTPTDNLQEDVLFAIGGLNHKKITAKNAELSRALKNRGNASHDSAATMRDAPEGDEPKLSSPDVQAMKEAGMSWNGKDKMYEKKLPSGRTLKYDPKSKKRFTV